MTDNYALTAVVSCLILIISFILIPFTCGIPEIFHDLGIYIWFGLGTFIFIFYGTAIVSSPHWSRSIPYNWFIGTAFINLGEVILLPQAVYLFTHVLIGWFIFFPWFLTLLAPFLIYIFAGEEIAGEERALTDAQILDIAKKYGGILTQSVIVWEAKITLKEARKHLERFVKYGEANRKKAGNLTVYDFPSTRAYLSRTDKEIIELLRDNPYGMSRAQLLQMTGLSIESIDEALKRLESKGIIYHEVENEIYKLTGIVSERSPTTNKERTAK
jgi:predicted transcriptional regulator